MTYSFTDGNGCTDSASTNIIVNALPFVVNTSNLNSQYCDNDFPIALSAYPSGGAFSGNGVFGAAFYPDSANIGTNNIIYNYTDSKGCSNTDTVTTFINSRPNINFTSVLNSSYCNNDSIISLSATPYGGVYSGLGITDSSFAPAIAGLGSKTIIYNYTDANNCSNSDTVYTLINPAPIVSITTSLNPNYCENAQTIGLAGLPIGGSFSGDGVVGLFFDPAAANLALNQIVYSYTDANACSNSDTITTFIDSLPSVSLGAIADVCEDVQQITLPDGVPSGGVYSGQAVSAQGVFYPQIIGSGIFAINYSYTDSNGCTDTAISNIKVQALPSSAFSIPSTSCLNDTMTVTYLGQTGPNANFTWNFGNANPISGSGAGPYELNWNIIGAKQLNLTVVDSGCTSVVTSNYTNILSSIAFLTSVGNTTICYGDSATIFANSGLGYNYQWHDTIGALYGDTLSYLYANQTNNYYCNITHANGCTAPSDTISIFVKDQIIADFNMSTGECVDDMVSISFNGTAPLSSIYNWDFDNGNIASGSGVGPYNIIWNTDSIKTVGLTVIKDGCTSLLKKKYINIISTPALITALGSTSFCDGGNVSLSANAGQYSYEWFLNNISTTNTQAVYSASQAGSYKVKVTDNNYGCFNMSDSIEVIVNTNNFNLAFTASQTNFTIPPFNTTFTNQTTNLNDYYWMWSFGDGSTSTFMNPAHQYTYDGTYSVGVIAQNITTGCFDTLVKTDYIVCNGGSANPCTLDPSIANIGGNTVCPGDSVKLFTIDHTVGISYQWLRDGILIAGAIDSVYYASQTGLYQLMLTDPLCSVFSNPFSLTQNTTLIPSILSNGSIQPCSNDSMELYVSTSYNNYQWSNGAIAASIYVKTSGSYIITITDNNGCQSASAPYIVNASLLQVPEICIVGIDTATNHNRIVWERQANSLIDSFNIYRESTVAGVYSLIGSQAFSTQSVFEDINSNPAQMSYRYRITAIDTCGMETAPSPIHKTIHLTINAGLGGVWNLIWTNYEGFSFGSYRIYRGTDSTQMTLLTQIQSTLTSYTDLNPPTGNVYYQIEVISPHPCYPDSIYSKANTNYNMSRSNTSNTNLAPNMGFVQSANNQLSMELYPNPNNGQFALEINSTSNKTQDYQLEVYSVMGKLIYSEQLKIKDQFTKNMSFKHLSKGVYIIRLKNDSEILTNRFIIE